MGKNLNIFDIRIKLGEEKIIDQKVKSLDEANNLFKDLKKKFG